MIRCASVNHLLLRQELQINESCTQSMILSSAGMFLVIAGRGYSEWSVCTSHQNPHGHSRSTLLSCAPNSDWVPMWMSVLRTMALRRNHQDSNGQRRGWYLLVRHHGCEYLKWENLWFAIGLWTSWNLNRKANECVYAGKSTLFKWDHDLLRVIGKHSSYNDAYNKMSVHDMMRMCVPSTSQTRAPD